MSIATRSQSQTPCNLLSTSENMNSYLLSKPFTNISEAFSSSTTLSSFIHNPVASKKPRRAKKAHSSSQKSQKRPCKRQNVDKIEQSQTTTECSLPDFSDSIIIHWACMTCSYSQGVFEYPVDSCIRCGHQMEHYETVSSDWDPGCDYICQRNNLVASIMQLLEVMRVVIIRATPQVGKTTLLHLLGLHVLHKRKDLEPVFIDWKTRVERSLQKMFPAGEINMAGEKCRILPL